MRPLLLQSLGLEVRPTCIPMLIGVFLLILRQFSLPLLVPKQLLLAILFAFLNLKGGTWQQKLASSAGAQKLEAISVSTVFTGRLLIGLKEKPLRVR